MGGVVPLWGRSRHGDPRERPHEHGRRDLDPGTGAIARDKALADGEAVLSATDLVLSTAFPGGPVSASCPDIHYVADTASFPPPPDNTAFGLPDVVGRWTLTSHIENLNPSMEPILQGSGVDPAAVRVIRVELSDGTVGTLTEINDHVSAPIASLGAAVRDLVSPRATGMTTSLIAGFRVIDYQDPSDPTLAISVAGRGDRVVVFYSLPESDVEAIIHALR